MTAYDEADQEGSHALCIVMHVSAMAPLTARRAESELLAQAVGVNQMNVDRVRSERAITELSAAASSKATTMSAAEVLGYLSPGCTTRTSRFKEELMP